jgi:hypothetical protein
MRDRENAGNETRRLAWNVHQPRGLEITSEMLEGQYQLIAEASGSQFWPKFARRLNPVGFVLLRMKASRRTMSGQSILLNFDSRWRRIQFASRVAIG